MTRTFFTSDTHFNDPNTLERRGGVPNDDDLVDLWNSAVGRGDLIYCLGDFAFSWGAKSKDYIHSLVSRLNGTKILITGNHDQSFKTAAGAPVGRLIAEATGWKFLGEEQARVEWQTPAGAFSLQLIHPGGGSSYALSYRPQKIVESLEGGTKPDMLAIGHYHKAEMLPSYRNVCGVQVGAFQRQTPFMARGGLAAHVGGWIIEVAVGDGHNRIKGEFIAFYT
jgi:hypothetical protein